MKKKLLTIGLIFMICVTMSGCININVGESHDDDSRYEAGEAAISNDIKEIEIEWVGGSIDVVYDDVDKISFSEASDHEIEEDEKMCYKIEGSELKIKFMKPSRLISFNENWSKSLTLTVPRDFALNDLSIDAVSSEIRIDNASFIKEVNIDVVSGDVIAYLPGGADEVSVDSVSGNVELNVIDQGFDLEFDTVSGKFYSEFETTSMNNHLVYGNGKNQYEIDTVSGNVRINRLA